MPGSEATTIAALATAPFPAGLAVVRVSGPAARRALAVVFRSKQDPLSRPRSLVLGDLVEPASGDLFGDALAVFMPGPHSFTGEDIVEFQFFGSPILVKKLLRSLYGIGIQAAEAGEFTKRAFLNGKLDLVQAEAIAEIANATSEQALKIASEHLKGRLSSTLDEIGEPLRDALAEIEAGLDFPDEEVAPQSNVELVEVFRKAESALAHLIDTYNFGQIVRSGFRVLLCGRTNVGKSSLLNLLLNCERAIVTDVPGTTRDLIEEEALLGGFRFVFCDSAGIRATEDRVEKIGVDLALNRLEWADLVLFVVDAADPTSSWQEVLALLRGRAKRLWMVVNKIDLNPEAIGKIYCESNVCTQNYYLSAKTRSGFIELNQALIAEVERSLPDMAQTSQVVTNERQRSCLTQAKAALERAHAALNENLPLEIVSAELRAALVALEELIGKTYTEDILGRIFSKFCIGK